MRIAGLVMTMGESTARQAIDSLRPHVDEMLLAVDSRTPPGWEDGFGLPSWRFDWADSFSAVHNEASGRLGHFDYVVALDADERLDNASRLRSVIEAHPEADVIALPRRHFWDLAGTREKTDEGWFPDWQYRIRKPHVRLRKRAHPVLSGEPVVARTTRVVISHYNLPVRSDADWARVNAEYARLMELEKSDPA